MFCVLDHILSQPSRFPSQSVRVSSYLGFRVTDPSQSAAELDPLLVRAMPFCPPNVSASWPSGAFHYHKGVGPQGHRQARATEPAPEEPRSIPRWAAWRCGFDSRGRLRAVHPRAHAWLAPYGADSSEALVLSCQQRKFKFKLPEFQCSITTFEVEVEISCACKFEIEMACCCTFTGSPLRGLCTCQSGHWHLGLAASNCCPVVTTFFFSLQ